MKEDILDLDQMSSVWSWVSPMMFRASCSSIIVCGWESRRRWTDAFDHLLQAAAVRDHEVQTVRWRLRQLLRLYLCCCLFLYSAAMLEDLKGRQRCAAPDCSPVNKNSDEDNQLMSGSVIRPAAVTVISRSITRERAHQSANHCTTPHLSVCATVLEILQKHFEWRRHEL